MDGPIDWWWKMNLLDVCVQAGFCQIRSHMHMYVKNQRVLLVSKLKVQNLNRIIYVFL